ncbi:MAG: VWA domain-containing protein, partial [Bacteroidota bacterium]
MQTDTLLYIILAGIAALLIALFQYIYKSQRSTKLNSVLALLRFVTLFSILLLLINPKFSSVSYYDEKPNLIVAIDNSESVMHLKQDDKVRALYQSIIDDSDLKERFNIQYYGFGNAFYALDSLSFIERQTNIAKAFRNLSDVYKNTTSPVVLISDGNQTYGSDYQFETQKLGQAIFPVILGDTTQYADLKIL